MAVEGLAFLHAEEAALSPMLGEKRMGHGIPNSPGLALGQAVSGKQEGTHSRKARSPANAQAAQQEGPARRQVLPRSVAVRRTGVTRVSLDCRLRGLTASLPLCGQRTAYVTVKFESSLLWGPAHYR